MRIYANRRSVRKRPYARTQPDQLAFQSEGKDTRIHLIKRRSDDTKPTITLYGYRGPGRFDHLPECVQVDLSYDECNRLRRLLALHARPVKSKRLPPRTVVRTRTPYAKKR